MMVQPLEHAEPVEFVGKICSISAHHRKSVGLNLKGYA
jgi:hypothetical protein